MEVAENEVQRVVVAGASGFVGMDLIRKLSSTCQVIALTRSEHAGDSIPNQRSPGVCWVRCNLFSLKQTEAALTGADAAYFLVHSMMPSARLTQGQYKDLDLFIADNFSRACDTNNVRRIIYLGGILPASGYVSEHLQSRFEVELALSARRSELVALRAGLVLGPGGSSSQILLKLVKRLPLMVCPPWTAKLSSPISLKDTVDALRMSLSGAKVKPGAYDLGGPELVSYRSLMERSADEMCLRRVFIGIPVFSTRLSSLWVSVISGQSKELVAPLIQSLLVDMRPGVSAPLFPQKPEKISLIAALHQAELPRLPLEISGSQAQDRNPIQIMSSVISIQRLPRPPGWNAHDLLEKYLTWLPAILRPVIKIQNSDGFHIGLHLRGIKSSLLSLRLVPERSDNNRALLFITGGILNKAQPNKQGRLEIRVLDKQNIALSAVIDFTPALPWPIYLCTQAIAHRIIMKLFAVHLKKIAK
ncbi:MAG: hypothetical protein RJB13_235 [Pseudomonadota bacterium]